MGHIFSFFFFFSSGCQRRVGGHKTPKNENVPNGLKRVENVFSSVGGGSGVPKPPK